MSKDVTVISGFHIYENSAFMKHVIHLFLHHVIRYNFDDVHEIILYDNNSDIDIEPDIKNWFPAYRDIIRVIKIHQDMANTGSESITYNLGIKESSTDYVACSHIDCFLLKNCIQNHLLKINHRMIVSHVIGPNENQGNTSFIRMPQISSTFALLDRKRWMDNKCSWMNTDILDRPGMEFLRTVKTIDYDPASCGALIWYLNLLSQEYGLKESPVYVFDRYTTDQLLVHLTGLGEYDLVLNYDKFMDLNHCPAKSYKYVFDFDGIFQRVQQLYKILAKEIGTEEDLCDMRNHLDQFKTMYASKNQ